MRLDSKLTARTILRTLDMISEYFLEFKLENILINRVQRYKIILPFFYMNPLVLNKNPYSVMILNPQGANSIGALSWYIVVPFR